MSALPPKADIAERGDHVCFVPEADVSRCNKAARLARANLSVTMPRPIPNRLGSL
jgi:hypothetical protein